MIDYSINVNGRLIDLGEPQVMGILNVTPDSFYAASRQQTADGISLRAKQIVSEGGTIIDIGACSTRPGSMPVDEEEERRRLAEALGVVSRELPSAVVSVDTYWPSVARMAVEEYGASIINDVGATSGSEVADRTEMFRMAARLGVPYVLTSHAADTKGVLLDLAENIQQLRDLGQKDIIVDPGFGFGKARGNDGSATGDYQLMACLEQLQVLGLPIMVGVSRKSMVCKLLGQTPDEALNGTTALHTIALMNGASILRVHDVRQAVECCRIVTACTPSQYRFNPNT